MTNGASGADTSSRVPNRWTSSLAILVIAAVTAVAVVVGAGLFAQPGGATVAVDGVDIPDKTVEAESVDQFDLGYFAGDVEWSDTPEPVREVGLTAYVEVADGEREELNSITCYGGEPADTCGFENSTNGSLYAELGAVNDLDPERFSPPEGGEVSRDVTVTVETDLRWDGGSHTAAASDTSTVTVVDPEEADPSVSMDFSGDMVLHTED